jgi:hypothetical protein
MTIAKDALRLAKKLSRKERNRLTKEQKRKNREAFLAMLGKTVIEKEVPVIDEATGLPAKNEDGTPKTTKTLEFPGYIKTAADGEPLPFKGRQQNPPQLGWLGGKTFKQRLGGRKNRPGEKFLHEQAIAEDASRVLAREVDKVLNPPVPEETMVPVVPINAAQEVASL